MSTNLVPLLDDLESRAKAMPALLQQVLSDTSSLQSHVDASAKASREVGLHLQSQTTDLNGKFTALQGRLQEERKRQTGRLSDASIGLRALEKQGRRHLTDLEDDRKATQSAVNKLCDRLGLKSGGLSKTLQDDIESQRLATNTGLNAIEKAHNRLATTFKKLLGELSNLDTAVKAAAQQSEGAVQRLLTGIQKAAGAADQSRQTFHTKATGDAKKFQEGLTQIHSQTLAKPTLGRTLRYSQDINTLKGSATRSLMSVKSGVDTHDTKASQAAATFERGYREHESNSNGNAAAARRTLMSADGELDNAWKKIPLDSEGNKDDRNLLQKAWDFPGYVAHKAWEFGAWAIKGVSEFVAKYHKEILIGLAAAAVVVGAVMLAPVVLPMLMAGASAAVTAIGTGVTAGLTMAGSAMAGIGSTLTGLASTAGAGLTTAATSAWAGLSGAFAMPVAASWTATGTMIPGQAAGAGWSWLTAGGGAASIYGYVKNGADTGDWSISLTGISAGLNLSAGGGQAAGLSGHAGVDTTVGSFEAHTPTFNLPITPPEATPESGPTDGAEESETKPVTQGISQQTIDTFKEALKNPDLSPETRAEIEAALIAAENSVPGESFQVAAKPVKKTSSIDVEDVDVSRNRTMTDEYFPVDRPVTPPPPPSGPPAPGPKEKKYLEKLAEHASLVAEKAHLEAVLKSLPVVALNREQVEARRIAQNQLNSVKAKVNFLEGKFPGAEGTSKNTLENLRHDAEVEKAKSVAATRPKQPVPDVKTGQPAAKQGWTDSFKKQAQEHWTKAKVSLNSLLPDQATRETLSKFTSTIKKLGIEEVGSAQIGWEAKVAGTVLKGGGKLATRVIPGVGWVLDIKDASTGYYYLYSAATGNWDAIPADDTFENLGFSYDPNAPASSVEPPPKHQNHRQLE